MKTKLLFLSTLLFSFSINAQIDFEAHITVDDTGGTNNATSVFAADLDGDGDMDMISASSFDDKIAWYENTDGLGNFGPQQIISETTLGATSVFAVDIDGDGDMDILAASYIDDTIGWFQNNGQGTFGPQQIISTLTDSANSVYATDADGDGDMDVFSVSALDDKIAWYENTNGLGSFGPQQIISTDFDYPLDVVAGDIDGDGDIDILSGGRYNNSRVAWFKNTSGQGNFVFQQELTTDISYCRGAILADIDGDGDLDIAATSMTLVNDRVIWFENTNGQGNFNNTPNIITLLTDNSRPEALYAKDFDNDGDLDIAVGTYNEGLSWFKNNGSGTFGSKQIIDNDIKDVQAIFPADLDSDGDQDLLMAASRGDRIAWHKNTNGLGSFDPANELAAINSANGILCVLSADLDGDGDKDILSALSKDDRIAWQENLDGQGTFSELITIGNLNNPFSAFAGDIDGDGNTDVISAGQNRLVWYKNIDGQGNFGAEQVINTEDYSIAVYATDINNDGDLDVFSSDGTNIYWHENLDGNGSFGPIQIISNEFIYSDSLVTVDLDGDGDKDLIVTDAAGGQVVWFENMDGQGGFSSSHSIDNLVSPESVYATDLDNDGDIDIITLDYSTNEVMWYENLDGQGNFGSLRIISTSAERAFSIYATDLDNDGDVDVMCTAYSPNEVIWFQNDGAGNFNFQQTISSNIFSANSIFADDFNGDGKIDILASSYAKDEIIWFENQGPLGIEENTTNLFSIYPNPTNGILNINSTISIAEISVYNNLGQLLFTSEETNQIDISTLDKGIYFVKISSEDGQTETKKIIKK